MTFRFDRIFPRPLMKWSYLELSIDSLKDCLICKKSARHFIHMTMSQKVWKIISGCDFQKAFVNLTNCFFYFYFIIPDQHHWGVDSPSHCLSKPCNWIKFIKIQPLKNPLQVKQIKRLLENGTVDELLVSQSRCVLCMYNKHDSSMVKLSFCDWKIVV